MKLYSSSATFAGCLSGHERFALREFSTNTQVPPVVAYLGTLGYGFYPGTLNGTHTRTRTGTGPVPTSGYPDPRHCLARIVDAQVMLTVVGFPALLGVAKVVAVLFVLSVVAALPVLAVVAELFNVGVVIGPSILGVIAVLVVLKRHSSESGT